MSQRKCLPNLVLIDATVCQILLKQKCDARTDGRTEGIPIVPLFAPQMAGDKNEDPSKMSGVMVEKTQFLLTY